MKRTQLGNGLVTALIGLALVGAGIWGWVWNLIKIFHIASDPITGMFIFRCLGVVVVPVGAVLGFL